MHGIGNARTHPICPSDTVIPHTRPVLTTAHTDQEDVEAQTRLLLRRKDINLFPLMPGLLMRSGIEDSIGIEGRRLRQPVGPHVRIEPISTRQCVLVSHSSPISPR